MLIDVHAHFETAASGRSDWEERNRRRLEVGDRLGITVHIASILGSYGRRSPTYFPSPDDVTHANNAMVDLQRRFPGKIAGYCLVNPNFPDQAVGEIARCREQGLIGVKLAASRRADDALLDPVVQEAQVHGMPVLQHVWQHRRRDWPGQEASDAAELAVLARRHPEARFILAHLGGGGDWYHSLRVVRHVSNIWVDLSGSGVDVDMIHAALDAVGPERLLWGTDLTLDAGWGKLRYLRALELPRSAIDAITHRNALALFPEGAFA